MKATISKEELDILPVETYNADIVLVDDRTKAALAIDCLRREQVLGFDTETRPSFRRGLINHVSLVQLATERQCFLFRLNRLGAYQPLFYLLSDENVKKVGLSLENDFLGLRHVARFVPKGFIDIQQMAKNAGIENMSLQKIYAILFDKKISKRQRLSNWEAEKLSNAQQNYAALDAWSCLRIYNELKNLTR